MLRGGIGCINSTEVVEHLSEYLEYAGNVKFWAIEMGTNDAWGGGDWNLNTYVSNMQTIIDSAKAHGITPVIARIIATDSAKAGWQINPAYLDAVDKLIKDNGLPQGPDFYSYFKEHPELLASDGVHPNSDTKGGQAMHHLWAEALAPLYAAGDTATTPDNFTDLKAARTSKFSVPTVRIYKKDNLLYIERFGKRFDLTGHQF
jgi:lysophospholipase L1-like esterase